MSHCSSLFEHRSLAPLAVLSLPGYGPRPGFALELLAGDPHDLLEVDGPRQEHFLQVVGGDLLGVVVEEVLPGAGDDVGAGGGVDKALQLRGRHVANHFNFGVVVWGWISLVENRAHRATFDNRCLRLGGGTTLSSSGYDEIPQPFHARLTRAQPLRVPDF